MSAISIDTVDDTTICRVHGEADAASAAQLREALIGLTAHRKVIVDFSGVPFIDSAGLGCLIVGARRVHDVGGYIVLSSARRAVHRLLHTVRMDRVLPVVETMREAFELMADADTMTMASKFSSAATSQMRRPGSPCSRRAAASPPRAATVESNAARAASSLARRAASMATGSGTDAAPNPGVTGKRNGASATVWPYPDAVGVSATSHGATKVTEAPTRRNPPAPRGLE